MASSQSPASPLASRPSGTCPTATSASHSASSSSSSLTTTAAGVLVHPLFAAAAKRVTMFTFGGAGALRRRRREPRSEAGWSSTTWCSALGDWSSSACRCDSTAFRSSTAVTLSGRRNPCFVMVRWSNKQARSHASMLRLVAGRRLRLRGRTPAGASAPWSASPCVVSCSSAYVTGPTPMPSSCTSSLTSSARRHCRTAPSRSWWPHT